ncbi:MAG TPA: DUF6473 family protein [Rhizomicrobium sp.]|jgi:hypothetical protein
MTDDTLKQEMSKYLGPFEKALAAEDFDLANRISMLAAERLLKRSGGAAREILWKKIFSKLRAGYVTQYQCRDFEIVDYKMYPLLQGSPLFRGPQPEAVDLAAGRYITVMGAAQLFGRFQQTGPHTAIGNALGLSAINLSLGGAGPETFSRYKFLKVANGGQAAILQILSGRSIGCDEYPGGRRTVRPGGTRKVARLTVLKEIWDQSPAEAKRLVAKWQARYVKTMLGLIRRIKVPVILTWISSRTPDSWSIERMNKDKDFGDFPHLVERRMLDKIAAKTAGLIEVSHDPGLPHGFNSYLTGRKCPRVMKNGSLCWDNEYYPSKEASEAMVSQIVEALKKVVVIPPPVIVDEEIPAPPPKKKTKARRRLQKRKTRVRLQSVNGTDRGPAKLT